ncbi:hypothetical protein NHX12_029819, partial [Muraenolepis orangiensis]
MCSPVNSTSQSTPPPSWLAPLPFSPRNLNYDGVCTFPLTVPSLSSNPLCLPWSPPRPPSPRLPVSSSSTAAAAAATVDEPSTVPPPPPPPPRLPPPAVEEESHGSPGERSTTPEVQDTVKEGGPLK